VTLTAPPASGTSAATLVDMYTRHGGRIVGKLTDSVTGKAIAGAEVSTDGQSQAAYVTNSDGSFILGGLMPGDYLVHVRAYDQKYVSPEFVPHQPTYSTAVSYSVADGQDTVVNETLLHADQIKGQVTDKATGLPAANVFVTAWPLSGPWIANSSAKTNAQGKFTLKGLGPGTYSVCFMDIGAPPPRFQSRCWRNQPRYSFYSGTPLTLYGFGTTRAGIDQALPRSN
jgi:5-hydroxyisourate hydrolase-like protein (transthyretin family)